MHAGYVKVAVRLHYAVGFLACISDASLIGFGQLSHVATFATIASSACMCGSSAMHSGVAIINQDGEPAKNMQGRFQDIRRVHSRGGNDKACMRVKTRSWYTTTSIDAR